MSMGVRQCWQPGTELLERPNGNRGVLAILARTFLAFEIRFAVAGKSPRVSRGLRRKGTRGSLPCDDHSDTERARDPCSERDHSRPSSRCKSRSIAKKTETADEVARHLEVLLKRTPASRRGKLSSHGQQCSVCHCVGSETPRCTWLHF